MNAHSMWQHLWLWVRQLPLASGLLNMFHCLKLELQWVTSTGPSPSVFLTALLMRATSFGVFFCFLFFCFVVFHFQKHEMPHFLSVRDFSQEDLPHTDLWHNESLKNRSRKNYFWSKCHCFDCLNQKQITSIAYSLIDAVCKQILLLSQQGFNLCFFLKS